MSIGKTVNDLYQLLGLEHPRIWTKSKIKHNKMGGYSECNYMRQTGRSTLNCLTAIAHLMTGDDVLIPVPIAHSKRVQSTFIENILAKLSIPVKKSKRSSGYLQIADGAQVHFASMSRLRRSGVTHQTGLGEELRGRTVDVILPDNALFDIINTTPVIEERPDELVFLDECERVLDYEKRTMIDTKTFTTNYGEVFRNGDLIEHGDSAAMIINLYEGRYNMTVLIDGQKRSWVRQDLNLMLKCTDED